MKKFAITKVTICKLDIIKNGARLGSPIYLKYHFRILDMAIGDESEKIINVNYFLDLAKKYYDIQKLDCEIIRTFIEKVIVHKAEKVDGKRCQRIEIKYIGIGVSIPN